MTKSSFLRVSILCILFFLIQLMNLPRSESSKLNNETFSDIQSWRSGRSSRSLFTKMPRQLRIIIQNDYGPAINLVWNKQNQVLANKHLPIALSNGYLIRNVMNVVGEFVFYHDFAECSAVVYFEKTKTLSGNVGLEFIIADLPFEFDNKGNYLGTEGHKFVHRHQNIPLHIFPQIPNIDLENILTDCNLNLNQNINSQMSTSNKRRSIKRDVQEENNTEWKQNLSEINNTRKRRETPAAEFYYLEILIFVAHDVVDNYKKFHEGNSYVEMIAKNFITFINTVDMMFNKIGTWEKILRINLAKIVLEDGTEGLDVLTNDHELLFEETVNKRRENLKTFQHFYPRDSYDHVFISTNRKIKANSINVPGTTDYEEDLYTARRHGRWFEAVPVTIMGFYEDPVLTVYEIGRTLNINVDPWNKGHNTAGQCYGIMQEGSSKCLHCLKWSQESSSRFRSFLSKNRNRCFLLNQPRSLQRSGARKLSSLKKQHQCYGYDSILSVTNPHSDFGYVKENDCDKPLNCLKTTDGHLTIEGALPPFDGTPCGGLKKVCWDGQCTPLYFT